MIGVCVMHSKKHSVICISHHMICSHYLHWVQSIHPTSKQPITCRLCYQEQEDHDASRTYPEFNRFHVTHMQCVFCRCVQPTCNACCNPECTMYQKKHAYYCNICHLWEHDKRKSIFHCADCGICRVGVRDKYVHCSKCNMCVLKSSKHVCVGGFAEHNPCPICYGDIAQSTDPPVFLPCGHAVHVTCLHTWQREGGLSWLYTGCPICRQK